jgi:hypothetical protein
VAAFLYLRPARASYPFIVFSGIKQHYACKGTAICVPAGFRHLTTATAISGRKKILNAFNYGNKERPEA